MEKLKTLGDFLSFFKAIPEEKWYAGDFTNCGGDKCCALGHRGWRKGRSPTKDQDWEVNFLNKSLGFPVVSINDGTIEKYQQPKPRDRICAAIRDAMERDAGCVVS